MVIDKTERQPDSKLPHLVTGGGRRLGLALVNELLAAGDAVVMTYRTFSEEVSKLSNKGVHCIQADFTVPQDVERLIAELSREYLGLRSIIHNASEWGAESHFEAPTQLMERMWKIHVLVPYQLNLALQDMLLKGAELTNKATDIIHLTDYVAEKGSDKHIAYAASKAGLANLSLSFARKLAPKVKVNSIAPSLLMFHDDDNMEYQQKALKKSLLCLEPGELEGVAAVQYVLSSRYMTGRTLELDGGRHLV